MPVPYSLRPIALRFVTGLVCRSHGVFPPRCVHCSARLRGMTVHVRRAAELELEREFGSGISYFVNICPYSFTYSAIWISQQTCLLFYNAVDMNNYVQCPRHLRLLQQLRIQFSGITEIILKFKRSKLSKSRISGESCSGHQV